MSNQPESAADDFLSCVPIQIIVIDQETEKIHSRNSKAKAIKHSCATICLQGFYNFHFKNWSKSNTVLKLFRCLSFTGLLVFGVIDTVMYSSESTEKTDALKFIHGLRYIPIEILTIIYASGAVVFGICIEVYVLVLQAIINGVVVAQICRGSDETTIEIIWIVKLILLFSAVELCHRNFRKLLNYDAHFNSSARYMLRQGLLVAATMLVENLSGLRALYRATNTKLPRLCKYETSHCGIVDMYEPLFWYDDDVCLDDLAAYVAGREQIRLLRDFILLNMTSYSMFNKHFLKIKVNAKYSHIRILLIILLLSLATSIPISYIDPLFFIKKCRLAYYIIEGIIFFIIMGLMAFNLYQLRNTQDNLFDGIGEMAKLPTLLP